MGMGDFKAPTRGFHEPLWRAVLWVFIIKTGLILGLVVGAVAGIYLCLLIFRGPSYSGVQFLLWIVLILIGGIVGDRVGTAIVRRLQGAAPLKSLEPSDESD